VRDRLRAEDLTARGRGPADQVGPAASAARVTAPPAGRPPAAAAPTQAELPLFPLPEPRSKPVPARGPAPSPPSPDPVSKGKGEAVAPAGERRQGPEAAAAGAVKAVQMHDLYLLVEEPDGILVIDQHALHERVLFEQFKAQLTAGRLEAQPSKSWACRCRTSAAAPCCWPATPPCWASAPRPASCGQWPTTWRPAGSEYPPRARHLLHLFRAWGIGESEP